MDYSSRTNVKNARARSQSLSLGEKFLRRSTSDPIRSMTPNGMFTRGEGFFGSPPPSPSMGPLTPNGMSSMGMGPLGSPRGSALPVRRQRALSECGRQLFADVYGVDLHLLEKHRELPSSLKSKEQMTATTKKKKKKSTVVAASQSPKARGNMFQLLDSSDDESDVDVAKIYRKYSRKNSIDLGPVPHPAGVQPVTAPSGKIAESVIGEDDAEIEAWETVPKRSERKRTERKGQGPAPRRRSPSPRSLATGYDGHFYMEDEEVEDDLWDLQAPTFAGRKIGSAKKTMQHKAMEKRGYAIDKRNRQRRGGL